MNEKDNDPVNHPSHYIFGGIEVIDAIEAWNLNYHRGNAVKYIARAGKKNPYKEREDLQKAVWYLNRELEKLPMQQNISANQNNQSGIAFAYNVRNADGQVP